jgi:hypothetical protein
MTRDRILGIIESCSDVGINAIYHSWGHPVFGILRDAHVQITHFIGLPNPWQHPTLAHYATASHLGESPPFALPPAKEALVKDLHQLPECLDVVPVIHPWTIDLLYDIAPTHAVEFLEFAWSLGIRGLAGTHYPDRLLDLCVGGFGLITTGHPPIDLTASPYPFVRQERSNQAALLRTVGERITPLPLILMKVLAQGAINPRAGMSYAFEDCHATAVIIGLGSRTDVDTCHHYMSRYD